MEQAGNSIGGAISQDGRLVATANYPPGGVQVFSAETLDRVADIPPNTAMASSRRSSVWSMPPGRFVFSLFEAGEIWIVDLHDPGDPRIPTFKERQGALRRADDAGRTLLHRRGLFGEDGLALVDLWDLEGGARGS